MRSIKYLFFPLWFLVFTYTNANAQSGYKYVTVTGGYLIKPLNGLTGTISLDFANKHHNVWSLFGEAYRAKYVQQLLPDTITKMMVNKTYLTKNSIRTNYLVGALFKPIIVRSKNTSFRLKVGAGVGTDGKLLLIAPQGGFELSQAFWRGYEFVLQQNNSYVFFDAQRWRSGVALGVKIPLD